VWRGHEVLDGGGLTAAERSVGIQATKQLVPQLPATRVVMLTTFDLDDYIVDAFRAGASGFLLKTAPPPQLVAAVRTVHTGDALLAPASTRRLIEQHARPRRPAPALDMLTPREHDVLRLLARGLTNTEIAAQLVVEPSTIKSHVASLLAKLGLRDRVQAVITAYETGSSSPARTNRTRQHPPIRSGHPPTPRHRTPVQARPPDGVPTPDRRTERFLFVQDRVGVSIPSGDGHWLSERVFGAWRPSRSQRGLWGTLVARYVPHSGMSGRCRHT
jgi:DNA-binding NarL/FixJ family response regulator